MRLLIIFLLLPIISLSQENIEWITHFGGSNSDLGRAITHDTEGNIYVAGEFLDSFKIEDIELNSNGKRDVFLAKLDSNGIAKWFLNFGGIESDWSGSLAVDKNQNIYLTGTFRGQITIGDSIYASEQWYDIFVVKLDKNGEIIWSDTFIGEGGNSTTDITIDNNGFIYITGYYNGILNFGNFQLQGPYARSDLFVAKINSMGDVIWVKSTRSNANNYANSLISDGHDHLYITGFMCDSVYFDNQLLVSDGPMQAYVSKIDVSNGDFLWAVGGGGENGWSEGNSITIDKSGDIIIGGWYRDNLYFNNDSVYNGGNDNGPDDTFIAKFNNQGNLKWIKSSAGSFSAANNLSVDEGNNIYLTGVFKGTMKFEEYTFPGILYNNNTYVAKINGNGDFEWLKSFGGNSKGYGISIFNNSVFVTGMYHNYRVFDDDFLQSNGYSDIFVLKLSNTNNSTIINGADIINSIISEAYTEEVLIYPNPCSNTLFIKSKSNESSSYQVKLLDVNGKVRFINNYFESNILEINVSSLPNGIYFLQINDLNNVTSINRKIIKNN